MFRTWLPYETQWTPFIIENQPSLLYKGSRHATRVGHNALPHAAGFPLPSLPTLGSLGKRAAVHLAPRQAPITRRSHSLLPPNGIRLEFRPLYTRRLLALCCGPTSDYNRTIPTLQNLP